jgi:hypothetical protein
MMRAQVVLIGLVLFFALPVDAQTVNPILERQTITGFEQRMVVNVDNSVDVTETIRYNTGRQPHHGIRRTILSRSSQGRNMTLSDIVVVDLQGNTYQNEITTTGSSVELKIGDPYKTFIGEKTYVIHYHATSAVGQLPAFDEVYWNVTGNNWEIPIISATSTITLPSSAPAIQFSCYRGTYGSSEKCEPPTLQNGSYVFTTGALAPQEGMTVAVGFKKGIVVPYTATDNIRDFFKTFWSVFLALFMILLSTFFSFRYWYKKGRDPKGTGIIVAQYDVPDDLTPMEVSAILNQRVGPGDVSAELIYLATKGYLKIKEIEKVTLGVFKSRDFELTLLKSHLELANDFDRKLLEALFWNNWSVPSTIQLSDIKVKPSAVRTIFESVADSVLTKGYYQNLGRMKMGNFAKTRPGLITLLGFPAIVAFFIEWSTTHSSSITVLWCVVFRPHHHFSQMS